MTAQAGDDRPIDETISHILNAGAPVKRLPAIAGLKAWFANRPPVFQLRVRSDEKSAVIVMAAQHNLSLSRDVLIESDDTVPPGHIVVEAL